MGLKNMDLRLFARGSGVTMHEIASFIHVSEPTLTRRWRNELPESEKEKYKQIIVKLGVGENDV